jgi:hypothetical protein
MKLNLRFLITGIILATFNFCNSKTPEFNSEYFIGKWTFYKTVEIRNGVEIKYPKIGPIKYEFKEDGNVVFGYNNSGKAKWKITENNKLLLGGKDFYFEHIPKIESYKKMKLTTTDTIHSRKYIYHYERGWKKID